MSHAINPDTDMNQQGSNDTNGNEATVAQQKQVPEMKTQEKVKIMAGQFKEKSKENAKKLAAKTKDRLSLEGQLRQARISLERFVNPKILNRAIKEDSFIPQWVLKKAKGIVFLTVVKAGFLFAGNVGTGCVIVRKPNGGWTGPSSIAVAGVSFGFLAGASKVDYIMILPDDNAVKQFTGNGQLRLGGEIQVALGPVGRDGSGSVGAGDKGLSVIFSYSHAQGLYGGLAFDGKIISVRPNCNDKYYNKKVTCFEILTGDVEPPLNEDYDMVVHLLDSYCTDDLTPMKGERISIDDLDKQTNPENDNDAKEQPGQNAQHSQAANKGQRAPTIDKSAGEIMNELGAKFQTGFNSMKSVFSKNKGPAETGSVEIKDDNNAVMNSAQNNSISPDSNSPDADHRPPY